MKTNKEQIARLNYLHIAPRKVRLVSNTLKGLSVNEAEAQLLTNSKRACLPLLKLLRSAVADAKNNQKIDPTNLFIKEIRVDEGPMLKRYLPRAMGRATPIQKKSSHVTLVLAESDKIKSPRFKIIKPEKVSKKEKEEKTKRIKTEKSRKKIKEKTKTVEPLKEKTKSGEKLGFIKKIFRRKAV